MLIIDSETVPAVALERLRILTDDPDAGFRPGQLEAIGDVVVDRARVLCVQRTGWGKSAVYFVATALLREAGAGPTLIVSPLLALMRNQIAAAERLGLRAHTINSTNRDEWDDVRDRLAAGTIDLLLISPERLNNPRFREEMLPLFAASVGLLVIDEAHCISDWGHDFRPDYRRVKDMLDTLPTGVAVLGTTATANDRVVADVVSPARCAAARAVRCGPTADRSHAPASAWRCWSCPGPPSDSPGWLRTCRRCRGRESSTRSPNATPSRSPRFCPRAGSPRCRTAASTRPRTASPPRTGCSATRSRRSSPPARSGWATTSPI